MTTRDTIPAIVGGIPDTLPVRVSDDAEQRLNARFVDSVRVGVYECGPIEHDKYGVEIVTVWYQHRFLEQGDPENKDYKITLRRIGGEWYAVHCECPSFASGAGCIRISTPNGRRKQCKHCQGAIHCFNNSDEYRDALKAAAEWFRWALRPTAAQAGRRRRKAA